MRNIKLVIEYDGTDYCGWQIQKLRTQKSACPASRSEAGEVKSQTIQETIEKALGKILKEKVKLIGSGRTDSGVHALAQVANFKTRSKMKPLEFKAALNSNLPKDIRIKNVKEVDLDFHSRFRAKSKLYRYRILNKKVPSVFTRNYCYFVPYSLDCKAMSREAKILLGSHNFSSFQAKDKKERNPFRTIKSLRTYKENGEILIDIEANGFLYNMARNIVGTLIEAGRGKLEKGAMKEVLQKKDRKFAGPTAPARGLCLVKVRY